MTQQDTGHSASRFSDAMTLMASENPVHKKFITSLRGLFTAREELASGMVLPGIVTLLEKDKARFLQGAPLLPKARMPLDAKALARCRERLAPEMAKAFPNVSKEITNLDAAFASRKLQLGTRLKSYLAKDQLPDAKTLDTLGVSPEAAALYLSQFAKVVAEAVARAVGDHGVLDGWTRGYCPVCGSFPELSYLEGKEGRRRLSCSLCAATWRYTRVACPSCESTDHDKIELFYLEDKPLERAEACHVCNRYILHVDRRERSAEFIPSLEPLGLVHLDMIMQKRGFTPVSAEPAVST